MNLSSAECGFATAGGCNTTPSHPVLQPPAVADPQPDITRARVGPSATNPLGASSRLPRLQAARHAANRAAFGIPVTAHTAQNASPAEPATNWAAFVLLLSPNPAQNASPMGHRHRHPPHPHPHPDRGVMSGWRRTTAGGCNSGYEVARLQRPGVVKPHGPGERSRQPLTPMQGRTVGQMDKVKGTDSGRSSHLWHRD